MGAGKFLELAVILKAIDNMSGTVKGALGGASAGYNQLANSQERADKAMKQGLTMGAGAKVALDILTDLSKKYGNLQEAQQDLRVSMMTPGGNIDEQMFARYTKLTKQLSENFGSSQMDYVSMIRAMKENKIDGDDILGGIGNAVAELSELFKTAPSEGALFAARLKNDMKVPADEMLKMVDLAARLKNVGVGHTGSEAIANMTEFYSKAGLGAVNMGMSGTKDAMELGALGGMFIAKGQDAPSVGTTFRRIFDNIAKPEKLKLMNEEAAKFGKHLVFFDKAGKFKGIQNFVAQLSTLHGMSPQAISQILGPAGSSNGMSGTVLRFIGEHGQADYKDFLERVANQGSIQDKIKEDLKGQNKQYRILTSDLENLEANIGKSYNPEVMQAQKLTQKLVNTLSEFTSNHQIVTKSVAGLLGVAGAAMAVGSAIKLIGAAWAYSGVGGAISWFASAAGFNGVVWGAEGFAMTLNTALIPALTSVLGLLSEIAVPAAAVYSIFKYPKQWAGELSKIGKGIFVDAPKGVYEAVKSQWDYSINGIKKPDALRPGTPKFSWEQFNDQLRHGAELNQPSKVLKIYGSSHITSDWKPSDLTSQMKKDMSSRSINSEMRPSLHYAPTINIQGNGDKGEISRLLSDHKDEVMQMLNQQKVDHARTSY